MKKILFKDLIILENDNVIVINKPPNVSSLDERSGEGESIIRMAKAYLPDAQLCHRLDKETSGCLLIAKNEATYRHISIEFEHRRVLKTYHAIVDGLHEFNHLEVDLPIGEGQKGLMKIDFGTGKEAVTYFNSIRYFKHYTLVECKPITGRTHQIRVHLATQRAIIANDLLYGGKRPLLSRLKKRYNLGKFEEEEQSIIRRFALHAFALKINNIDGTLIDVSAEYPKDFGVFVKLLEKHDA